MRTKGAKNKPKLVLKEVPNTVVHVPTRAEYDELMRIYAKAGWEWGIGGTKYANWSEVIENMWFYIEVKNGFFYFCKKMSNEKAISLSQFKKLQGLEPEKKAKKPEFKVGDRVKIVDSTFSPTLVTKARIDTIGIVKVVRRDFIGVGLGEDWCGYNYSDLQLLPSKKRGRPKKTQETKKIEPLEMRVSDWIIHMVSDQDSFREVKNRLNEVIEAVNRLSKQ